MTLDDVMELDHDLRDYVSTLHLEIASLKSQLAEAQKDRERLDWLFGVLNSDEIRRRLSLVEEKHAYGSWTNPPMRVGDFRAAFDAAMEAKKHD